MFNPQQHADEWKKFWFCVPVWNIKIKSFLTNEILKILGKVLFWMTIFMSLLKVRQVHHFCIIWTTYHHMSKLKCNTYNIKLTNKSFIRFSAYYTNCLGAFLLSVDCYKTRQINTCFKSLSITVNKLSACLS